MRDMTGSSALNTSWRSVTGDFLANVFLTPLSIVPGLPAIISKKTVALLKSHEKKKNECYVVNFQ